MKLLEGRSAVIPGGGQGLGLRMAAAFVAQGPTWLPPILTNAAPRRSSSLWVGPAGREPVAVT